MRNQKPQVHNLAKSQDCSLYKPGHQVHWLQARAKAGKPHYAAKVRKFDDETIEVSWLGNTRRFHNHAVARILDVATGAKEGSIRFSPDAHLLYIQTEAPNHLHDGVFELFYLANESLTPCTSK